MILLQGALFPMMSGNLPKNRSLFPLLVVFTDLDSTLLHKESYSWEPAREALDRLRQINASLVMVSSKTFAEMVELYQELGFKDPFIVENGGAIVFDSEHFLINHTNVQLQHAPNIVKSGFSLIPLGKSYHELVHDLRIVSQEANVSTHGFYSMDVEEVSLMTGLPSHKAILAKKRDFDEPFLIDGSNEDIIRLQKVAQAKNLKVEQGGRFWHLFSHGGKGAAVSMLQCLFRGYYREIYCVGLGDSPNDLSFLELMDTAILLGLDLGSIKGAKNSQQVWRFPNNGPDEWNLSMLKLLSEMKEVI